MTDSANIIQEPSQEEVQHNRRRIDDALEHVRVSFIPILEAALEKEYGKKYQDELNKTILHRPLAKRHGKLEWDVYSLLTVANIRWKVLFQSKASKVSTVRSFLNETLDIRNRNAHSVQALYQNEETQRALDTIVRLLKAFKQEAAEKVKKIVNDSHRKTTKSKALSNGSSTHVTAWRRIVNPQDLVLGENIPVSSFAANLHYVLNETSATTYEYKDAEQFFEQTHITQGLERLFLAVVGRIVHKDKSTPIIQLQTVFGGGKTHAIIALYHLFTAPNPGKLYGIDGIIGGQKIPRTKVITLLGTNISPAQPDEKPDGTKVHTIWGELAYQIGGKEAYEGIKESDVKGVSPSAKALGKLLLLAEQPILILIDELTVFFQQLSDEKLPAGTYERNLAFIRNLTEAVPTLSNCALIVSLPQSETEAGGEQGKKALNAFNKIFGRLKIGWHPASADESFKIVSQRLFKPIDDPDKIKLRDRTIQEFHNYYKNNSEHLPPNVITEGYAKRMKDAYPFHPSLFDFLYEKWSSLEKFQRTRGVLRLLALVIRNIYYDNDLSPLIMPGHVNIDKIQSELDSYLGNEWNAVIRSDIEGDGAIASTIERTNAVLAKHQFVRKATRAIYLATAPMKDFPSALEHKRGIDKKDITLAAYEPNEEIFRYNDALSLLDEQAQYLYKKGSSYWFSIEPNLVRLAQEIAKNMKEYKVDEEIERYLKNLPNPGSLVSMNVAPKSTKDIPDDRQTRFVILGVDNPYPEAIKNEDDAEKFSKSIIENHGAENPRSYKNTLLFLAADEVQLKNLRETVRANLSWQEVKKGKDEHNLPPQLLKQVEEHIRRCRGIMEASLHACWQHIIYPYKSENTNTIEMKILNIQVGQCCTNRAWAKLIDDEVVVQTLGAKTLHNHLESYFWCDKNHVKIKELSDAYAKYLYLPRLSGKSVLENCIAVHIRDQSLTKYFFYASSYDEDNNFYRDLGYGDEADGTVSFHDEDGLLVKPDVAKNQFAEEENPLFAHYNSSTPGASIPPNQGTIPYEPQTPKMESTTFTASVPLYVERLSQDVARISKEVLAHITDLPGAKADISLKISIKLPKGVSLDAKRIVEENASTLHFDYSTFKDE